MSLYAPNAARPKSNKTMLIIACLLLAAALGGGAYWYFYLRCKSVDEECSTTSDCCENLECIDSTCTSIDPISDCSQWTCPSGKKLISGSSSITSGMSESTCCVNMTCADWRRENPTGCGTGFVPSVFQSREGNSSEECCRNNCGDWQADGNTCLSQIPLPTDTPSYSREQCCEPGIWVRGSGGQTCDTVCNTIPVDEGGPMFCHPNNNGITTAERLQKVTSMFNYDCGTRPVEASNYVGYTDAAGSESCNFINNDASTGLPDGSDNDPIISTYCRDEKEESTIQFCNCRDDKPRLAFATDAISLDVDGSGDPRAAFITGIENLAAVGATWGETSSGVFSNTSLYNLDFQGSNLASARQEVETMGDGDFVPIFSNGITSYDWALFDCPEESIMVPDRTDNNSYGCLQTTTCSQWLEDEKVSDTNYVVDCESGKEFDPTKLGRSVFECCE